MKSRISSKGQVTVPAAVRDALGLVAGTAVDFLVREGEAVMRKSRQGADPVDRVYGKLHLTRSVDALLDDMRGPRPARARAKRRRTTKR
ncbi:MAG: AbrB/MazE/SpoVT family DNA-binding domain-containing protein [Burkholderiales bacterium]